MKESFKIAVCQMKVVDNKPANLEKAASMLKSASSNNADIAVLPEMFNCPYDNSRFSQYAENREDSETLRFISEIAVETRMYIVAGSIPERDGDKLYNTSFIFDKNGKIIGSHRKTHLFDIDVPGKITFRESDVLTAGNSATIIDTEFCKIGIAICYDMRFPEFLRMMAQKGAKLIIVPGAFNMVTGPAHWEPLIRIRALDNQVYMAAASPARDEAASYVAYGNSMVVDPWGKVLAQAEEKEEIIYSEIQLSEVERIRNELPLLRHRREDIYFIGEK